MLRFARSHPAFLGCRGCGGYVGDLLLPRMSAYATAAGVRGDGGKKQNIFFARIRDFPLAGSDDLPNPTSDRPEAPPLEPRTVNTQPWPQPAHEKLKDTSDT